MQEKFNWRKRIIPIAFVAGLFIYFPIWRWLRQDENLELIHLQGQTMGTTYSIKYRLPEAVDYQTEIDTLLQGFNQCLSTYVPDSELSQFNRLGNWTFESPYFYPVLHKSQEVYQASSGAFDPTVMPLVKAWGFGPGEAQELDSARVDSLLAFVGWEKISFDSLKLRALHPGVQLDFSAIAKGYGCDVVADYLKAKGVRHLMVEIGGEVVCQGLNAENNTWRIGIDHPETYLSAKPMAATLTLADKAVATSGNYRNYVDKGGQRLAHTINPKTGYAIPSNLLSATVVATDCITADAWATALMVMGARKAISTVEQHSELEAFLIFTDSLGEFSTYTTEGLKSDLVLE
ncbi:MAG: FAD:protein FMN transferase [Cytophagales bacterium]|nr:FAD:protein FMN transferase [Cytophagales bacterium]